jgi:hypothetical protein
MIGVCTDSSAYQPAHISSLPHPKRSPQVELRRTKTALPHTTRRQQREARAEVIVQNGTEANGIDIRFRGETGYTISGTLIDRIAPEGFGVVGLNGVVAMRASDDMMEAQVCPGFGQRYYILYLRVPDGDYYLLASVVHIKAMMVLSRNAFRLR